MNYAHVNHLIDYFATLEKTESINLVKLEENIFKNCTQNFLSGNQKMTMISAINRLKINLQDWDEKWFHRINDETCPDNEKEYLTENRLQVTNYHCLSYSQKDVIDFLNDQPRSRWLIQSKKYSAEIIGNSAVDDAEDATE